MCHDPGVFFTHEIGSRRIRQRSVLDASPLCCFLFLLLSPPLNSSLIDTHFWRSFFFSRSQRAVTPDPCQTRASNQEWGRSSGRRDAPNDARMWTGSRGRRLQRKTNEATLSLLTVGKSWAQRKGRNRFDIVRFWTDELDLESLHWLDTITVQIVLRHRG